MGIDVQKKALSKLFHFARVRAASKPHVSNARLEVKTKHSLVAWQNWSRLLTNVLKYISHKALSGTKGRLSTILKRETDAGFD